MALQEPFRIFFPIGVAVALLGVALWPLFHWQIINFYPGFIHARLMSVGFFGAFIIGFLTTAVPRFLSAPKLKDKEVVFLVLLHLSACICYAIGLLVYGDAVFLLTLVFLRIFLVKRFTRREDMPPPGIILVIGGTSMAMGACGIFLLNGVFGIGLALHRMAQLFLYEGFILCPILGIAPFIFPGFGGLPNRHNFPEARKSNSAWRAKAWLAGVVAFTIALSYFLEGFGLGWVGSCVRLAAIVYYLIREIPLRFSFKTSGSLARLLQAGILSLTVWLVLTVILPDYRVTWDHLLFMGGYALIVIGVATRVILGHSGQGHRLRKRMPLAWVILFLILLAMASRITPRIFFPRSEFRTSITLPSGGFSGWAYGPRLFFRQ